MESRFYSTQEAVSDGTLTQLIVTVFFPPGSRDSIHVFFDGVEDDDRWSWSAPNVNTILFREPVPAGQTVLVRRLTQMDEVPHIFGSTGGATGNSQFSYVTVDENFDFFKRATQDSMDSFLLTGASAEQAQFWALQAEVFSNSAEGYRNGAAASAASATTSANLAGQSANAAAQAEQGAVQAQQDTVAYADAARQSAQDAAGSSSEALGAAQAASVSQSAAQGSATAAASSASGAASSATASQNSANSASGSATAASNSATAASTSATNAANSAVTAGTYRDAAASSAASASTSQTQAAEARDKAQKWAQEAEDVPVEPGLYSAFHWAQKAKDFAGGDAYLQKDRNLSDLTSAATARTNLGLKNAALVNIVGTMGGGDIVERGSNANGEFVRFAGGLQVCLFTGNAPSGPSEFQWTYPVAFIKNPFVNMQTSQGATGDARQAFGAALKYGSHSRTGTEISVWSASVVSAYVFAIGMWRD